MDFGDTRRRQRDKAPRWRRREHATTGVDQIPGTSSRHPLYGGPPAAGRQRVFVGARSLCRFSPMDGVVWSLAIAGVQRTMACSRLSPPVPGPRGGRGHTCRTPSRGCSVSNATPPSVKCQAGT